MASSTTETQDRDNAAASEIIGTLEQARRQFLALVDHVRPELLRYCTRMTGSVADGEDVVQETLARACFELPQLKQLPLLRPWLFRIAHHRAIDHWRHEALRASEPLDAALDVADAAALEPDHVAARHQAVRAAVSSFLALAPAQRGCVVLKDVLEHSIDEIAAELNLSIPAVKAALHRGRAALHRANAAALPAPRPPPLSPALKRYAGLFNAHDWEGVRSLLADDVRLDLVSRRKAAGRRDVGNYLDNYQRTGGWHLVPGWFDGREVLAVLSDDAAQRPRYFIELGWRDGRVVAIRDFRYVSYIAQEGTFELAARAGTPESFTVAHGATP
jgi:RNA polymerase sigma-70 factor (ECF subfamily)